MKIGVVDQAAYRDAFSLEDARSSPMLMITGNLSELKVFNLKMKYHSLKSFSEKKLDYY